MLPASCFRQPALQSVHATADGCFGEHIEWTETWILICQRMVFHPSATSILIKTGARQAVVSGWQGQCRTTEILTHTFLLLHPVAIQQIASGKYLITFIHLINYYFFIHLFQTPSKRAPHSSTVWSSCCFSFWCCSYSDMSEHHRA